METLSYFPLLPTAALVISVVIDMVYVFRNGKKIPFDIGALVFLSFPILLALFMAFGAGQGVALLKKEGFSKNFSEVFSAILLFIGFQLTKRLDTWDTRKIKEDVNKESYMRLMRHIGYPAGAVVFLFIGVFVLLVLKYRVLGGVI
jgi:tetrahydromethanopterin S-methyltransferase subunit G